MGRTYFLLWYTGFLFLFVEVVLFSGLRFTTSYLEAHLIIALSILGLLFGGAAASQILDERVMSHVERATLPLSAVPALGFLGVVVSAEHPGVSAALLLAAFTPLGFIIGLLYRRTVPRVAYTCELLGAALGVLGAAALIPLIREENTLLLAFALSVGVGVVLLQKEVKLFSKKLTLFLLFGASVALLYNNLVYDRLNLLRITLCSESSDLLSGEHTEVPKLFCQLKNGRAGGAYEIVLSQGSLTDRVDVVRFYGESNYRAAFSGAQTDIIQPHDMEAYEYDARIPRPLFDRPKTLVIGMGIEGVGKVVQQMEPEQFVAVDINPVITDVWQKSEELISYGRDPYAGATLYTTDGRSYLESSAERFDLITMMNTHRTRNAGHFGEPDFLHTKEAFVLMLEHLTDEGVLIIEEPNFFRRGEQAIENILATVTAALKASGATHPEQHLALYTWVGAPANVRLASSTPLSYVQIIVSRTPLTKEKQEVLYDWSQNARLTTNREKENNMVFQSWIWPREMSTSTDAFAEGLANIVNGVSSNDARSITDDRPFPVPVHFSSSLLSSVLIVFAAFVGVVWWYWRLTKETITRAVATPLYFIGIGIGYAAVEVLLLQWSNLYLGSVSLSFVVTLGGLLIASGLASFVFAPRIQALTRTLFLCSTLLAALLAATFVLFGSWHPDSLLLRGGVVLLFSAAIGGSLGLFFPGVLAHVQTTVPQAVPLLVALNGSALAIGIAAIFFATSLWGFGVLALFTVLLYGVAGMLSMYIPAAE